MECSFHVSHRAKIAILVLRPWAAVITIAIAGKVGGADALVVAGAGCRDRGAGRRRWRRGRRPGLGRRRRGRLLEVAEVGGDGLGGAGHRDGDHHAV